MPCCAASHCCNREIGVRLFRFPKEIKRKEIWRVFCERGEWQPTKNHKLCEVHFDEDQFESQALTTKGNRKLKPGAVPTIYVEQPNLDTLMVRQIRRIKQKHKGQMLAKGKNNVNIKTEVVDTSQLECGATSDDPAQAKKVFVLMLPAGPNNKKMGIVLKGPKDLAKIKQLYGNRPFPPLKHLKMKTNKFKQINKQVCAKKLKLSDLTNQSALNALQLSGRKRTVTKQPTTSTKEISKMKSNYERKIRLLMAQNNCLRKKLSKTNLRLYVQSKCMGQIFNADQLQVLAANYKRPVQWSEETINTCRQLRLACGRKGYRHLIGLGYPLPTVTALMMKPDACKASAEDLKVNDEVVECNVEITIDNE